MLELLPRGWICVKIKARRFKFALNVAFFVRHEYFLHPKSGNLQEVSQESLHIYNLLGE